MDNAHVRVPYIPQPPLFDTSGNVGNAGLENINRHQSTSYHSCHSCHSSPRSLTCSLCPGCPCKHLQCTCKASRFEVSRIRAIRVSKNGKHETNISNMYFIELHCTSTQGSVDVGCAVGNVTGRRIVVCGPVLIVAGSEARSQSLPRSAVTDVTCCLESAGPDWTTQNAKASQAHSFAASPSLRITHSCAKGIKRMQRDQLL